MPNFRIDVKTYEGEYAARRGIKYTLNTKLSELQLREMDGEAAIEAIQSILAIFAFLSLVDINKYFTPKERSPFGADELAFQFEYLGELGMALSNNCYAKIDECLKGYRQLMEEREDSE